LDTPNFDIGQFDDDDESELEPVLSGVKVISPSGTALVVMNQTEADFYNEMCSRYMQDNKLKNVSDLLELDRILVTETMVYRWGLWILSGQDYQGRKINVAEIQKSINTYSKEIREIKAALGVDKVTRDKDKGENLAEYINMLGVRAEEFGIHRNNQIIKAITMLKQLFGIATLNKNSNEREQKEFGATDRQIVELILSMKPEFDALDEEFRKNQRIWIRDINE
jgi:hypothetical protein